MMREQMAGRLHAWLRRREIGVADRDLLLDNAPEREETFFKVPKILSES